MRRIFDAERIGYAYLYPNDGGERRESVLATTPENLANYVGSHFFDAEKMVVTDMCDWLILDTYFAMEDEAVGMAEFLLKKMQKNGLISEEEREKITVLNIETFSPELAEVYL